MRLDKEAFVKRWWSKYQVQYALIESPVKRIEFFDRLLAQSKHVLYLRPDKVVYYLET